MPGPGAGVRPDMDMLASAKAREKVGFRGFDPIFRGHDHPSMSESDKTLASVRSLEFLYEARIIRSISGPGVNLFRARGGCLKEDSFEVKMRGINVSLA